MVDNRTNYFIIERKDNMKESESLKNIYDLSILDKINTVNTNKKSIKNIKKFGEKEKENIIRVVKKAILSTNFSYKWRLDSFKRFTIIFQLMTLIIVSQYRHYNPNKDWFLSFFKDFKTEIEYNISLDSNKAFNNITNETEKYWFNIDDYNSTNITEIHNKSISPKYIIIVFIYNQIFALPFWFILLYVFVPKWKKLNNTLYKITKYLLDSESLKKGKYYFFLMKNYSLFLIKKRYYKKKLKFETKNQRLFSKNINLKKINKNIFNFIC